VRLSCLMGRPARAQGEDDGDAPKAAPRGLSRDGEWRPGRAEPWRRSGARPAPRPRSHSPESSDTEEQVLRMARRAPARTHK